MDLFISYNCPLVNKLTSAGLEGEFLIIIKMCISSDATGWCKGMSQGAIWTIEGVMITMRFKQEDI